MKKNHYAFHLPDQLDRYKEFGIDFLLNCWVTERKHRTPKKIGNQAKNLKDGYDVSVHREVTMRHLHTLQRGNHFAMYAHLINARKPPKIVSARIAQLTGLDLGQDEFLVSSKAKNNEF